MGKEYTVRGRIEGVVVKLILPVDVTPGELKEVLDRVKGFADSFEYVEDFNDAVLTAVIQRGH